MSVCVNDSRVLHSLRLPEFFVRAAYPLDGANHRRLNSFVMTKSIAVLVFFALFSAAPAPSVTDLKSPAGNDSAGPNLAVSPDGRAYLSWLEPLKPKGYALRF